MGLAGEEQWSDKSPTVGGEYWVKYREGGREIVASFDGEEWFEVGDFGSSCRPTEAAALLQFGRRIPTNAGLCELPGLLEELHYYIADFAEMDADELLVKIRASLGVK